MRHPSKGTWTDKKEKIHPKCSNSEHTRAKQKNQKVNYKVKGGE